MQPIEAIQALLTPEGRADPYPFYAVLDDHGPVLLVGEVMVATGYDVCAQVLRDPTMRVQDDRWLDRFAPGWRDSSAVAGFDPAMLNRNSPDHERMRRPVSGVFSARRVAALADRVERITADLLDAMDGALAGGATVDFMEAFAFPLPCAVISELLGVPEADRPQFRALASDLTRILDVVDAEELTIADAAADTTLELFAGLVERRRAEPAGDLLSALVGVHDADPASLTYPELLANLLLIMVAGFETTTNLLGNGLHLLLDRPELADRLREDPGLAPACVEEVLRFDSPVQATSRHSLTDREVGGLPLTAGAQVQLLLGAANRDPRRFTDPHTFAPGRPDNQPLSFGAGAHFCLGAALARTEARIALPALLRRFPSLRPAAAPTRRNRFVLRGYEVLPVST